MEKKRGSEVVQPEICSGRALEWEYLGGFNEALTSEESKAWPIRELRNVQIYRTS